MKKFNADFRGSVFRDAAIGTCLALSLFSSPASFGQTVYELEDYSDRLIAMNVPAAELATQDRRRQNAANNPLMQGD